MTDNINWTRRRKLRLSKEGLAYAGLKSESIILEWDMQFFETYVKGETDQEQVIEAADIMIAALQEAQAILEERAKPYEEIGKEAGIYE